MKARNMQNTFFSKSDPYENSYEASTQINPRSLEVKSLVKCMVIIILKKKILGLLIYQTIITSISISTCFTDPFSPSCSPQLSPCFQPQSKSYLQQCPITRKRRGRMTFGFLVTHHSVLNLKTNQLGMNM